MLAPTLGAVSDASITDSDGRTPTLTPHGTLIVPPPGTPMRLVLEEGFNVSRAPDAASWGEDGVSASACTRYRVGWYATDSSSLWGGHMGIVPQHMPPLATWYCPGQGMGYTNGVSFGSTSWIQAGLATFAGELGAKWFCQSNDYGTKTTLYGPASAYGNGATVYTWFARDSSGVWRTYRYDGGPYSVELGCTLNRGASGNLQVFGEIQGATSTSAPMGPWRMFDLRYLSTNNQWYVPSTLQAFYPGSTPCPPYGAGSVTGGWIDAGTGKACTTGTSAYPN